MVIYKAGFFKRVIQIASFIIILLFIVQIANIFYFYSLHFENKSQSDFFNPIQKETSGNIQYDQYQLTSRSETINPPNITYEEVVYCIICPSNLTSSVEPLMNWKTKKGVPTKIFNIDGPKGIFSVYPGVDNAAKIHNFLTSLHENNSKLNWVLLVGDEEIIPSRQVFVNASKTYGLDDFYYSDLYYAGLNNSWDQDNDGIYGEQKGDVDWQADLYVGRLPVNNVSETDIAINKILKYEQNPDLGQWMKNVTVWSGLLDGPNNLSAYQSYKDNAIKVTNKILDNVPKNMNINHLYDYNQLEPGNYSFQSDLLTHTSGKESFNAGSSILNFAGQAYYTGDELAQYDDVTGMSAAPEGFNPLFSYNDGKYSTNGNKLPFLYLSTCSVNFTERDDSNLEQLITAENGGVIGLIGNSGKSYRGEAENGSSYGNWWLSEHYWELFFSGYYQPGKCLYELKEKYVNEVIQPGVPYIKMAVANLVGYNLLGDPELNIWTDTPTNLSFNYSVDANSDYKLNVTVKNELNERVKNARVCVYNENNYEYSITGEFGEAILDLDPKITGTLELTITAQNHLPMLTNFTYKNKPPEFGIINDISVDEDNIVEDYVYLKLYADDPDNEFKDLSFSINNITDTNAGVKIDILNNIDIKPYTNWFGMVTVTVRVTDGIDFADTSFKVTIKPVNDPPKFIGFIEDQEIQVGDTFEYQVQGSDIENDELIFTDDTKLFNINKDTGVIQFKASEDDIGTHTIIVTVSDGNKSSDMTFEIKITKDLSILEIYWFPITVIIVTIIIITAIKLYSLITTGTKKEQSFKSDDKDKDNTKEKKNNEKKSKKASNKPKHNKKA